MTSSLFTDAGLNLYFVMEIIGYLIFTFIGSLLKEIFNTNSVGGYMFQAHRVISSTIAASTVSVALRSMYLEDQSYAVMVFISFTLGLLGFEIFKNLCSIDGIKKLISEFTSLYGLLTKLPNPDKTEIDKPEKKNEYDSPRSTDVNPSLIPSIRIHPSKKHTDDDVED